MDVLKIFDAYSLRARLFPAIIAAAPALAAFALLISWKTLELSNVIATLGLVVLLFAIADSARAAGRKLEKQLNVENGGLPSVTMFRRNDDTIDAGSKDRYRSFLATQLGVVAPTAEQEHQDQRMADSFYEQCGVWLRENTRDIKKFSILFGENVTYGFRRNLLGGKWFAMASNLVVVAICAALLWRTSWSFDSDQGKRVTVVLVVGAAHALYMTFAVRRTAVWDASRAYGRQLILSCEHFLSAPAAKKSTPRKTPSKQASKEASSP